MTRAALATFVLVTACGDSGTRAAAERDASAPRGTGVAWRSFVVEFVAGNLTGQQVLADVEVCVDEGAPRQCVSTDEDGIFTLRELPPEAEILIVYEKVGFTPVVHPIVTPRWSSTLIQPGWSIRMARTDDTGIEDAVGAALSDAGKPAYVQDWATRGSLSFGRHSAYTGVQLPPQSVAALEPASGEGPYIASPSEDTFSLMPSEEPMGWGLYGNVEPGDYELVWNEASGHCRWSPGPVSGWRPTSGCENASRIVVRAGHATWWTALDCPVDVPTADAGLDASSDAGPDAGAM